MVRQGTAAVQDQLPLRVEGDLVRAAELAAQQAQSARRPDPLHVPFGHADVHRVRLVALQTEQDGLGGAVTVAGGPQ